MLTPRLVSHRASQIYASDVTGTDPSSPKRVAAAQHGARENKSPQVVWQPSPTLHWIQCRPVGPPILVQDRSGLPVSPWCYVLYTGLVSEVNEVNL